MVAEKEIVGGLATVVGKRKDDLNVGVKVGGGSVEVQINEKVLFASLADRRLIVGGVNKALNDLVEELLHKGKVAEGYRNSKLTTSDVGGTRRSELDLGEK